VSQRGFVAKALPDQRRTTPERAPAGALFYLRRAESAPQSPSRWRGGRGRRVAPAALLFEDAPSHPLRPPAFLRGAADHLANLRARGDALAVGQRAALGFAHLALDFGVARRGRLGRLGMFRLFRLGDGTAFGAALRVSGRR
jgi:hypothetical protein